MIKRRSPRSVEANVLDCNIVVREFDLQSHYYVYFRTNTLGKDMNPLIPQLWFEEYNNCCSIELVGRVFAGRPGFNPRSNHTKNSKMVLDVALLNIQHKVRIKGKVKQFRERSSAFFYILE